MAGFYTSSFTLAVTHVLAEDVLSAKCTQAYKTRIPVMRADWIEAVWKESLNDISKATDSHFTRFVCPIFYNINFCFSQIDPCKKQSLVKIVESNGKAAIVSNDENVFEIRKDRYFMPFCITNYRRNKFSSISERRSQNLNN
jgi:hypothetical protein